MTSMFTFVNTIDAPSLSASSAKAMRSHITKTNFANRRKRIAAENGPRRSTRHEEDPLSSMRLLVEPQGQVQQILKDKTRKEVISDGDGQPLNRFRRTRQTKNCKAKHLEEATSSWLATRTPPIALKPTDPYITVAHLATNFCPIMFPSSEATEKGAGSAPVDLLVSEPAFEEATLALGALYEPQGPMHAGFLSSEGHLVKAISLVNEKLSDPRMAVSDGVLAAVYTLAVREELKGPNNAGWGIHIDGLAKMLTVRRDQGGARPPEWLLDAFIYNGFYISTSEQQQRYQRVLDAVAPTGDGHAILNIRLTSMYIFQMVRGIELNRRFPMTPEFIGREIGKPASSLTGIADRLRVHSHPILRASGFAILAFVGTSWPPSARDTLEVLGSDLRTVLEQTAVRPCSIKILIWQLLTGGAAAAPGSEDRAWFVLRLAIVTQMMPSSSWDDMLRCLAHTFMPDTVLLGKMKAFWQETETQRLNTEADEESPIIGTAIAGKVYP